MSTAPKSFIWELRQTAMHCTDMSVAKLLRDTADDLQMAVNALVEFPTMRNMAALNGHWAHAQRTLSLATMATPPESTGGRMAVPAERLAA